MKRIIAATNNEGKLKEIREILIEYEVISMKEAGCSVEIEEDQDTFEGNAIKKAKEIAEIMQEICVADDSGLCIASLEGFPRSKDT